MGNRRPHQIHRSYSKDEIDFLNDSAEEIQDPEKRKDVAKAIGRSHFSVYAKAKMLGIIKQTKGRSGRTSAENTFYARRRADLATLKKFICPRCGSRLYPERVSYDNFRLWDVYGHSYYYENEDLQKISMARRQHGNSKLSSSHVEGGEGK